MSAITLLNNNNNSLPLQGYGLYAKEEVVFDEKGDLTTRGPLAYRIPRCTDIPGQLNVRLLKDSPNPKAAIYSSKVTPSLDSIGVFRTGKYS